MNTIELKDNFHSLIDRINNENLLLDFYNLLKIRSATTEGQLITRLSKQEHEELLLSLEESDNNENMISQEEMKNSHIEFL